MDSFEKNTLDYFVNENKLLKTQLNILSGENTSLKQEIFRLNSIIEAKNDEILINENKISRIEYLNEEINQRCNKAFLDKEKIQSEIHNLIEEDINKRNNYKQIEKEKEDLKTILAQIRNELKEKDKEYQLKLQELASVNLEKNEFYLQISELKNQLTNEKYKSSITQNDLSFMKSERILLENNHSNEKLNLQSTINYLNENLRLEKEQFIMREQELNIQMFKLKEENQSFKSQNENYSLKIDENIGNLQLKDRKIEELSQILTELKRHVNQSQKEMNLLKDIISDKEAEIQTLHQIKRKVAIYENIEKNLGKSQIFTVSDLDLLRDELRRLSSLHQVTKKELDISLTNNELYKTKLTEFTIIQEKYTKLTQEHNDIVNRHSKLINQTENIEKENSALKRDLEILEEFNKKLSMQNRALIFEQRMFNDTKTFLSSNLSKQEYEEFMYKNITELEAKLVELMKKVIRDNKEKETLADEKNNIQIQLKEKEEVIVNLENYIKELEDTNINIKKEYDTLKYYSESHYSLFTLNYSQEDMQAIENLQDKLLNYENQIRGLSKEKEKLLKDLNDYEDKVSILNKEALQLSNKYLEKDREFSSIQFSNSNLNNIRNRDQLQIQNLKIEIERLIAENLQIKSQTNVLVKEKEELINSLRDIINGMNNRLTESNSEMKNKFDDLYRENQTMRELLDIIKGTSLEIMDIFKVQQTQELQDGNNLQGSNVNLILKEKLLNREKEYTKMKNTKIELEIKIDNLLTENSSLKYQNEFLEKRIKFFQHNIHTGSTNKVIIKKIQKNEEKTITSILKEKKLNVTHIGMNENDLKKYSLNLNEEVGRKEVLVATEKEITENAEEPEGNIDSVHHNANINQSDIELSNQMIVDSQQKGHTDNHIDEIDDILYKSYLACLKQVEDLKNENRCLNHKIDEVTELNQNLAKNDIGAPYKYLCNRIEHLNNVNTQLENDKIKLVEEKEKILKDFAFINLKNESLKKSLEEFQHIYQELTVKIGNLEGSLKEQMKHNVSFNESKFLLEEKDDLIKNLNFNNSNLVSEINKLNETIKFYESRLVEKENNIKEVREHESISLREKEKEFKQELDLKNKEIAEAKIKYFKSFYSSFKRAKNVIHALLKLKTVLEDKILNMKDTSNLEELNFSEFNKKISSSEQEIFGLKRKMKEMEETHLKNIERLNFEIAESKEKEITLINEIKTFKNINLLEGSVDLKSYFTKMLKQTYSAINIIKYKDLKIRELETQLNSLQKTVSFMNSERNTIDLTCDRCSSLESQIKLLTKENEDINRKLMSEVDLRIFFENKLTKSDLENVIYSKELKDLSRALTTEKDKSDRLPVESQTDKNKIFSTLINQMRKAMRIVTLLEKHMEDIKKNA